MKFSFKSISAAALVSVFVMLGMSACAPSAASTVGDTSDGTAEAATLRLGYFDNVTHGPALVGLQRGNFSEYLGETHLETHIFSAGPAVIEALSAGAIDAAYIGPSPAINSFLKSAGASLVVVSGVTSGGASLVVRDGIKTASDLGGTVLASPQLGNSQDIALRSWLARQGYKTSLDGSGDVTVQPSENAQTLSLFATGAVDGAWLPEPWASRLIIEAGAHELVSEADLWAEGKFPTTVLVVSRDFFDTYPATVAKLVTANDQVITWMNDNPGEVGDIINAQLTADTGKALPVDVLTRALSRLTFTNDPDVVAFEKLKASAVALKLTRDGSIEGLFQLDALKAVLAASGRTAISHEKSDVR